MNDEIQKVFVKSEHSYFTDTNGIHRCMFCNYTLFDSIFSSKESLFTCNSEILRLKHEQ